MSIKPSWIVCDMKGNVLYSRKTDTPDEFKTEAAAIKRAKEHVTDGCDDEAWVYKLTHVVSRPKTEPDVEAVE